MAIRRTAVGIDLGTTDVFAANVGRKGVEIVQNSVSERRTPALVGFTSRRRLLGDAAYAQLKSNYKNTCRGLKHLVGRAWDSPDVEAERIWALSPLGKAEHGDVGYEVNYCGEEQCVSATVCLSMLVTSIIATCQAWTKMEVRQVVLAIPSYYTEQVRQACLDALYIAGVQCLRLLHESTAIALAWRFERRSLEETEPVTVAFCSAGHSGLLVAVARFEQGGVAILGEAYDRCVSGRAMDMALLGMFVESLKKQGAPDPMGIVKARLKLEEAATKVKKTLSVVEEATAVAECVVEDFDLTCDVKKARFEELCASMAEKAKATVANALEAASVTTEDVAFIEIVGGCSRVPWLQRTLKEAFGGRDLSTTLNADEAVARGCAWQAAMLSPSVRLQQIPLKESGTPTIVLEWQSSEAVEAEGSEEAGEGRRRLTVFEAHAGPNVEAEVSFRCRGPLEMTALRLGDGGEALPLGTWRFDFPDKGMEDVELQCSVDLNGIFSIAKAEVCAGKEAVEAAKAAAEAEAKAKEEAEAKAKASEATPAEEEAEGKAESKAEGEGGDVVVEGEPAEDVADAADEAPPAEATLAAEGGDEAAAGADDAAASGKAEEAGGAEASPSATSDATGAKPEASPEASGDEPFDDGSPLDGPETGDGDPKSGFNWRFWQWGRGKDKQGDNKDSAPVGPQKRKVGAGKAPTQVTKESVPLSHAQVVGFPQDVLTASVKAEKKYRAADQAVVEAEDRRNDYETYIFTLRDRVSSKKGQLIEYTSPEELEQLSKDLEEAESWTYEHPEEEASTYAKRLKALKKAEDESAKRKANWDTVEERSKMLKASIRKYKATANSTIYEYIAKEKLDTITTECDSNTQWLADLEKKQAGLKKWDTPLISASELLVRNSTLTQNSTKVLSEPRPKPPEAEKKDDKNKKGEADKGKEDAGPTANGSDGEAAGDKAKPKRRVWLERIGWVLFALPGVAILTGLGEPYGYPSPLSWVSFGGDGDPDDAAVGLEAPEPLDEGDASELREPLAGGEDL